MRGELSQENEPAVSQIYQRLQKESEGAVRWKRKKEGGGKKDGNDL